ncbi:MAG: response regulator [Candidatus Omnitrophota bacterium]
MDKLGKKRIFVADDQVEILSLLEDSLTGAGFEVKICNEPKNALNLIKSFKPHLILLDLRMPNLGGFEICEILNNDTQTHGIPIIIVSGFGDLMDIKQAYKLGAVSYIVKPFPLDLLFKEVNKALTNKEKTI